MKKTILAALCFTYFISFSMVNAQELTTSRKVPTYWGGALSNPVGTKAVKKATTGKQTRTVTFRFDEGVTTLSDAQKERLLLIVKRITDGETRTVRVVSASKNEKDAGARVRNIGAFLKSYSRGHEYIARFIDPIHVVPSTDNTVTITERY